MPDRVLERLDRTRWPAEAHVSGPVVQSSGHARRAVLQHAEDPERPGLYHRSTSQQRLGRTEESRGVGHEPERTAEFGESRVLGHAQEPGCVPVLRPETRSRLHGRAQVRVPERQPD